MSASKEQVQQDLPENLPARGEDELEEYFGDRTKIDHLQDLGFDSQEQVHAALAGLDRLLVHPAVSERVVGKYKAILKGQLSHVAQRRTSRRRLVRNLVIGGALAVAAPVIYTSFLSPEAVQRAQEEERRYKAAFENKRTLGLSVSSKSFYGWSARYGPRQEGVQYEGIGITFTVSKRGWIRYSQSPLLEHTGLWLDSHVRSTDGKPVPKFFIRTNNPEDGSSGNEDIWLLRATDDSDSSIDTRVLILENDKDPVLRPLRLYAAIDPVDDGRYFEVKLKRPVDINQRKQS